MQAEAIKMGISQGRWRETLNTHDIDPCKNEGTRSIRTYKSRFKNGLDTFPHYSTCENFWRKKDIQTSIVRED